MEKIKLIHAAANPHDWAYKNPKLDFEINAKGTPNVLENTKKYSSQAAFIFLSTNKVYGDGPNNIKYLDSRYRYDLKKHLDIKELMKIFQ